MTVARTVMTPGWQEWLDEEVAWPVVAAVSADVREDAGRHAPRDTGDLKGSYRVERHGKLTTWVGSHLDYGSYVELGTKPHIIKIKTKKVLYNNRTGQFFGKIVHHPGTRAQPHLRPALYQPRVLRRVVML